MPTSFALRAAALAVIALTSLASAVAAAESVTARRNADLRYEPREGAGGETFVLEGERLEVVERRGPWMSVRTAEGDFGWVLTAEASLSAARSPARQAPPGTRSAADWREVRTPAALRSPSVGGARTHALRYGDDTPRSHGDTPRSDGDTPRSDGDALRYGDDSLPHGGDARASRGEAVGGPSASEDLFAPGEVFDAGVVLHLLEAPRGDAGVVERVGRRESLEVVDVRGEWVRLRPRRGAEGWARTAPRVGDHSSLQRMRLPGSHVLRRQATVIGAVEGRAGDGEIVTVVEERGDWLRVEAAAGRGWIRASGADATAY